VHGLSLPEEFALLSLTDTGKTLDATQAAVGCAAAELGELAMRGKVVIDVHKQKIAGFDVYRTGAEEVRVVDATSTGLGWADEVLVKLGAHAAEHGKIMLRRWLRRRREAFALHRNALVQRGRLRRESGRRLFRVVDRYLPDATRGYLIADLRAARGGLPEDPHMLLLTDLVVGSGLSRDLGITYNRQHRLDRGRGIQPGRAVPAPPQALLDASAVLSAAVPKRSRRG